MGCSVCGHANDGGSGDACCCAVDMGGLIGAAEAAEAAEAAFASLAAVTEACAWLHIARNVIRRMVAGWRVQMHSTSLRACRRTLTCIRREESWGVTLRSTRNAGGVWRESWMVTPPCAIVSVLPFAYRRVLRYERVGSKRRRRPCPLVAVTVALAAVLPT